MKLYFTLPEVKAAQSICSLCQHCDGIYCERYKTDSTVFKVERCDKLKMFDE